jgi:hypothetical protein
MEYLNLAHSQKKAASEAYLDQIKANNSRFFELMALAFQRDLAAESLRALLFDAAWKAGFKSIKDALTNARNEARQSALIHAYQEQDFKRAQLLIAFGAPVGPQERAAFDVALDSDAARSFGLIQGNNRGRTQHIVKRFGLTLGIKMTSVDGTFSQYGHSAPTYQLMAESVTDYAQNHPDNDHFQHIAEAFNFANQAASYVFSTAKNPLAGNDIVERIRHCQAGRVTTVPISCKGHEMGLSFVSDGQGGGYMIFTNRGKVTKGSHGTHIFKLNDFSKVTPKFINNMLNGHSLGLSLAEIMRQIDTVTDGQSEYYLPQAPQKRDNCTIANPRANIHGILLCLRAIQQGKSVASLDDLERRTVNKAYKQYTHAMRLGKIKELVTEFIENPEDPDLKNLIKNYLIQHPNASAELRAPLTQALDKMSVCKQSNKPILNCSSMTSTMDTLSERPGHRFKSIKVIG